MKAQAFSRRDVLLHVQDPPPASPRCHWRGRMDFDELFSRQKVRKIQNRRGQSGSTNGMQQAWEQKRGLLSLTLKERRERLDDVLIVLRRIFEQDAAEQGQFSGAAARREPGQQR